METGRTCGQLQLFASVVEDGSWVDARIDHADPERAPVPAGYPLNGAAHGQWPYLREQLSHRFFRGWW